MSNLSFVVFNGLLVDVAATTAAFQAELTKISAESEAYNTVIASAVSQVFDAHRGARLTTFAICQEVCVVLGTEPEKVAATKRDVTAYIRANSGDSGSALFGSKRGVSGGVVRWSDAVIPTAQPVEAAVEASVVIDGAVTVEQSTDAQ